ncbi:MAG: hypothetical protein ACI4QI_01665 [Candidatus Coproplasma sp.]
MNDFDKIAGNIKVNAKPDDVNIIYPFVEVQSDKTLSIVGVYDNEEEAIVNGIGESIPFIKDNYYYGLSPAFGVDKICEALNNDVFKDSNSLNAFINKNAHLFTLPASMMNNAKALFAKTLVKMSTMFGYSFVCVDKDCFNHFCETIKRLGIKSVDYDVNEKTRIVRLLGHPSEELISGLNKYYMVGANNNLFLRSECDKQNLREWLSPKNLSLVQGKTYYSGVLPRVKEFIWRNLQYANSKVMSLEVKFGRSTFATMDALDSSYIKDHRLLKDYKKLLDEMDEYEDKCTDELLCAVKCKSIFDKVNDYLKKSYSAHNLAVSGNIITSDGYVVLAKRGQKTYDANTVYCSVNGQSEIYDKSVAFYQQSVYEDMPTIHINDNSRIDFMRELERETEAELNIVCPDSHWKLQGVSFLSIKNSNNLLSSRRRFHFNILGECKTEHSLSHIIETQKNAIEEFENSKIVGVKINQHNNIITKIMSSIKSSILLFIKSKELVTSIFAISIFFLGLNKIQNTGFTFEKLSDYFSIIFTSLSFCVIVKESIVGLVKYIKRIKTHIKLSIYKGKVDFYKCVHCKLGKRKINLHPIADLMLYEYIKNSLR